jgi:hypothetical protein
MDQSTIIKSMETGLFDITNNVYMSGDVHGDYLVLVHILVELTDTCYKINSDTLDDSNKQELCNGYDFYLKWNDKNDSYVIFNGDLIDSIREANRPVNDRNDDIFIYKTLIRLQKEAFLNGGNILVCIGNHEMAYGYNFDSFYEKTLKHNRFEYVSNLNITSVDDRIKEFMYGSRLLEELSVFTYYILKINNLLITHGGINVNFIKRFYRRNLFGNNTSIIEYVNYILKNIMITKLTREHLNGTFEDFLKNEVFDGERDVLELVDDALFLHSEHDSPIIDRTYGEMDTQVKTRYPILYEKQALTSTNPNIQPVVLNPKDEKIYRKNLDYLNQYNSNMKNSVNECIKLEQIFKILGIDNNGIMVIGHTAQPLLDNINLGINSTCNNMVWRIDVGMSKAYDESIRFILDNIIKNKDKIGDLKVSLVRFFSEINQRRVISILQFNKKSTYYKQPIILTKNKLSAQLYSEIDPKANALQCHDGLNKLIILVRDSHLLTEIEKSSIIAFLLKYIKPKLIGGSKHK